MNTDSLNDLLTKLQSPEVVEAVEMAIIKKVGHFMLGRHNYNNAAKAAIAAITSFIEGDVTGSDPRNARMSVASTTSLIDRIEVLPTCFMYNTDDWQTAYVKLSDVINLIMGDASTRKDENAERGVKDCSSHPSPTNHSEDTLNMVRSEIRLIAHPAVFEDILRGAFELMGIHSPIAHAKEMMTYLKPYSQSPEPVSSEVIYQAIKDNWTYFPAIKEEWIQLIEQTLDAAGVKYVD